MNKYYVYTLAYPAGMSLEGVVFYVGKGSGNRVKAHDAEAKSPCSCKKCKIIHSIWKVGLQVQREIIHETADEDDALAVEQIAINFGYDSRYLVNINYNPPPLEEEADVKWGSTHQEGDETYLNMTEACIFARVQSWGTKFLFLAAEFGLSRRMVNNVNYYRFSELQKFKDWWRVEQVMRGELPPGERE